MDVLIGVGGSELSIQALEETTARAAKTGDSITVAVIDSEGVDASVDAVVERVREHLETTAVDAGVIRLEGEDPAAALVQVADEEGYDRIVLGSGKRSTLGKIQLGSVAEFVLLNAATPVTLIR